MQTSFLSSLPDSESVAALAGFRYKPDFIASDEEQDLVKTIRSLSFERFKFRQYLGNRRVHAFGYSYDFTRRGVEHAEGLPAFLEDLRARVAAFSGRKAEEFVQEQVLEYAPGAGIGWHRDKPEFGIVVGVSLGASAVLRFRRRVEKSWLRVSQPLEPRSVYLMSDAARHDWEHSIVPQSVLRYSVMFRTFAEGFVPPR
jgi:alkylated DNA repair dioxygenase AlkB